MNVEWIMLADAAEVVNNKLYLLGGGWETLTVQTGFPAKHPVAVAAAYSVPWNETNQVHRISIDIDDQDGATLAKVEGHLQVGRPPGLSLGASQRIQLAARLEIEFAKPGAYAIVAKLEDQEEYRMSFNVLSPMSAFGPPPIPGA